MKEPLYKSIRFRTAVAGMATVAVLHYFPDLPEAFVNDVTLALVGLLGTYIVGRSIRNTG